MSSTRSSSPASAGEGQHELLTPRSKIKALLAAVDSSEDEGATALSKTQNRSKRSSPLFASNVVREHSPDDGESDVEVRPRGRLAARMHAAAQTTVESATIQTDAATTEYQSENDVNNLPVAPRRLKRRSPQPETELEDEPPARSHSPGLFVSSPLRPSPSKTAQYQSESDNDLPALRSDRFKALVEKKKQQMRVKEAADEARKAEHREKLASELEQFISDDNDDNLSDIADDDGGRRLTQEARPTRKASKKAIEDMNRESQRMARNMQLAHEAKTRKKISKSSLFERFNYRPASESVPAPASSSRHATPTSDDVEMKDSDTPPSSPPLVEKNQLLEAAESMANAGEAEAPLHTIAPESQPSLRVDKGKGKEVHPEEPTAKPKRQVRVRLPQLSVNNVTLDSDDELEITDLTKGKLDAVFNNVPSKNSKEGQSMQALRALAQLKSPGRKPCHKREQPKMSVGELQSYLQQKARQQAKLERESRLQLLKAQGVVVQTAEERERQMQEVEDIVAKAREEAEQIMAQERAEAKQNNDGQKDDPLSWDDSDDEEYQASADEDDEAQDVELSGSEEEGEEEEGDGEETGNNMFDEAAEDASEVSVEDAEEVAGDVAMADDDADETATPTAARRVRKRFAVLSDDEAEVQATPRLKSTQATPKVSNFTTPGAPGSVLRSAKKSFIPGLPVHGPAGLGLTQIFAGTMDDSQMTPVDVLTQSMMPDFDHFPDSHMTPVGASEDNIVLVSQTQDETQGTTQGVQLNFSQSQMRGLDSLLRDIPDTQISEMIEPSQDGGIEDRTPLKERFIDAPESTVDTVVLDASETPHDSPLARRGRLRRRLVSEVPEGEPARLTAEPSSTTAFNALKEGALKEKKAKLMEDFNRKKSKAKEMVEEQAEESEDEYQGLGGYDGEDSDDESIASVKEMIDDAAGNDVDERKLAAFYADRERANDEQQVQKLFKDITSGMLRRKRGADYDLSDSDDGGEARRRRKRQQFAKMQKALYADERVKKIAENPGNQAFLRTIEDHGSDDEMDILGVDEPVREDSQPLSQPEQNDSRQQIVPDSQPRSALGAASENRAPAHMRRTKGGRKPANIGEVRETLSNLLEDGRETSIIPATEVGSDSEEEDEGECASIRSDKENDAPNPRRGRQAVVDRITLQRNASNSSNGSNSRQAFAIQGSSSSFKVPALLRRATTNSLMSGTSSSSSSTGVSTPTAPATGGGFGDDTRIKKAAGKKSGINAFARENERRAKLAEGERRRQEKKIKGAERRIGVVGGLLGKGSFE